LKYLRSRLPGCRVADGDETIEGAIPLNRIHQAGSDCTTRSDMQ
jgi:enhancing lycopene biosynthesis protein 2